MVDDVAPAVLSRLNWSLALEEDQTVKPKRFTAEQIAVRSPILRSYSQC
jgi:hypothetical protein